MIDSVKNNFSEVKTVHNSQNGGFGYGNNRGVELSTGEYLLFLNPDTLLTEPIFQYAIKKFEQDDKLAIFGFRQLSKDHSTHYSYYLMDEVSLLDNLKQKKCLKNDTFIDGKMFIAGSEMFMRKDVFEKIGGFEYSGVAEPVIPVNRATTIPVARASRSRKKSHAFILITSI